MSDEKATTLADYVGTAVDEYVRRCAKEASALVANFIGNAETVPEDVKDRAILEVGAELWNRKGTANGIRSFSDMEGVATVRIARNPMVAAYPILTPYMPLAFS